MRGAPVSNTTNPTEVPVASQEEEAFPSTALAYEHVHAAYAGPQSRMDILEARMGALISLTVSATLAVPTLLRGVVGAPPFGDWRFVAAMVLGAVTVAIGVHQRNRGTIRVVHPGELWEKYLTLPPAEFQRRMLYWAGKHWEINTANVERKARLLDRLTYLFVGELVLLAWWVLS